MRLPTAAVLALLAIARLAPTTVAQVAPGSAAPALEIGDWVNHPKIDAASLRGQVVALAFVRIAEDKSLFFLDQWAALQQKFSLEPVAFVAVSGESAELVKENVETESIDLPIALSPAEKAARAYSIQVFPSTCVIDPRGQVVFFGAPGAVSDIEDAVAEALRTARPFPDLGKKFAATQKLLDKWEFAKASAALERDQAKKLEPAEQQRLGDAAALIEALTARLGRAATTAIEQEDWLTAVLALNRLATEHAGIKGAEDASDRLAALKGKPELAAEIDAALEYSKADRFERDRDWKGAYKAYEALGKKAASTKVGAKAQSRALVLKVRAERG